MAPLGNLTWEAIPNHLWPNCRRLTDGVTRMLLMLDLTPRPQKFPHTKGLAPHWLLHFTTHSLLKTSGRQDYKFPVVSLIDGTGDVPCQLVLTDPRAWNERLRGTILPPYVDQDRRIDFPELPPLVHPLDGPWGQYDP